MRRAAFTRSKSPGERRSSGDERRDTRPPRIEEGGVGCRTDAGMVIRCVMRRGMALGEFGVGGGVVGDGVRGVGVSGVGSLGGRVVEREMGGRWLLSSGTRSPQAQSRGESTALASPSELASLASDWPLSASDWAASFGPASFSVG
jgi:hypothetical protein